MRSAPDDAGRKVHSLTALVTIVDGGETLARCLEALERSVAQCDVPCEILVPWDDSVPSIEPLRERFPNVRFLSMGTVPTERPLPGEAARHELYDRRRAVGLDAASGDVIAMFEDRGLPRVDHLHGVRECHENLPYRVIGGAVDLAVQEPWNRALFLCDFGRYRPPVEEGPARFLTDICVSYRREAILCVRPIWKERYVETLVHDALRRRGETLWLTNAFVVDQWRTNLRLGPLLHERFHWARLYAATRVQSFSLARSLAHALATPLLPAILLARILARTGLRSTWRVVPHLIVLLLAWSVGEAFGYATRRP